MQSGQRRLPRFTPLFSPVATACALLLLATPNARAQTAAEVVPDKLETVVVSGIRHGIETSVAAKRNSDSILETVSAEDIGKLPDQSIAESLARLPGLAGQRVAGRAQVIQIRGLSPDFAGTLLNGRQQVTTGDNRSVEFDQFPSELIGSATVYKTPDASLVGQGLSGTIDLRTLRPLSVSGRRVSLNARFEANSNKALNANTDVNGKRFSAAYVDQFADRTIGIALGFAHLDSPGQELHYKAWGFTANDATRDIVTHPEWGGSPVKGVPAGATFLNGFEVTATSRKQTRDGVMGVFEFKPNDSLHSTVDLYFSKFKKNESMRGLMGGIGDAWNGVPNATYSGAPHGATASVTGGKLDGASAQYLGEALQRDPDHPKALWLQASLLHEQKHYAQAVEVWRHLASVLPADSSDSKIIAANIAEALRLSGNADASPAVVTTGTAQINGTIDIDPKLRAKAGAGQTLFVFAKSVDSPGPPLAVVRTTVGQWPIKFSLNDSQAMMPQRKLSDFHAVTVEARISANGQPLAQPGDLHGVTGTLDPKSDKPVHVVIGEVIG